MERLDNNWLTEGLIDFEYKKYILLAYLKNVRQNFNEHRLYPYLSDLIFHYENLKSIKEQKHLLYQQFPERISKTDFEKLVISYEKILEDDNFMIELEEIIEFGLEKIRESVKTGKEIYDNIEDNMDIIPIGLVPLYQKEGYMMVSQFMDRNLKIFRYMMSIYEKGHEEFRSLNVQFLETLEKEITMPYEQVKISLIRKYKELPNPATYLITSRNNFPFDESIMPIAKRMLMQRISVQAA